MLYVIINLIIVLSPLGIKEDEDLICMVITVCKQHVERNLWKYQRMSGEKQ